MHINKTIKNDTGVLGIYHDGDKWGRYVLSIARNAKPGTEVTFIPN